MSNVFVISDDAIKAALGDLAPKFSIKGTQMGTQNEGRQVNIASLRDATDSEKCRLLRMAEDRLIKAGAICSISLSSPRKDYYYTKDAQGNYSLATVSVGWPCLYVNKEARVTPQETARTVHSHEEQLRLANQQLAAITALLTAKGIEVPVVTPVHTEGQSREEEAPF